MFQSLNYKICVSMFDFKVLCFKELSNQKPRLKHDTLKWQLGILYSYISWFDTMLPMPCQYIFLNNNTRWIVRKQYHVLLINSLWITFKSIVFQYLISMFDLKVSVFQSQRAVFIRKGEP